MNPIRIYTRPTKEKKWYWALQEFDYPWWSSGAGAWVVAQNFEISVNFEGYERTKLKAIEKSREAAKEYCFQRKMKEETDEYIGSNTYIEELSCQDLK